MGSAKRTIAPAMEAESASDASVSPPDRATAPRAVKFQKMATRTAQRFEPDEDDDEDEDEAEIIRQDKLAKQQRIIKQEIAAHQDDLANPGSNLLDKIVRKAEAAFQEVRDVQSACKDAEIVSMLTTSLREQAANIGHSNQKISGTLLSKKLYQTFSKDGKDFDLAKLGAQVQVFFRATPRLDCMLGPIDAKFAPKKERAKRQPRPEGAAKHVGATQVKGEAEDTDGQGMFKLHQELQVELVKVLDEKRNGNRKSLPVFEAVVDPKSFTQTVENIFALSFLVKDAKARLFVEDDVPEVQYLNQAVKRPEQEVQFVAAFTRDDWKTLCEEFDIEEGLLKHRELGVYDDVKRGGEDEDEEE